MVNRLDLDQVVSEVKIALVMERESFSEEQLPVYTTLIEHSTFQS
jgi:hypothetical protein